MANFNKVMLLGNLTRDPISKATLSGTYICEMGLAVNRRYRSAQGEDREEVCYVDLEAFGRTAEICAQYLRKGSPAFFEGRLRLDQWVDKNTNQNRSRLKVVVESIQLLGSRTAEPQFAVPGDENMDYSQQDAPANAYAQPPGAYQQQQPSQYSRPAYQPPPNQGYQQAPPGQGYQQAPQQQQPPPAYQRQAIPPPAFPPPPSPQPQATAFPPPPGSYPPSTTPAPASPPSPVASSPPVSASPSSPMAASPAPSKTDSADEVADNTYEPIPPPGAPASSPPPAPTGDSNPSDDSGVSINDVPF